MNDLKTFIAKLNASNDNFETEAAAVEGITSFIADTVDYLDERIGWLTGNYNYFEDISITESYRLRRINISMEKASGVMVPTLFAQRALMGVVINNIIADSAVYSNVLNDTYKPIVKYMAFLLSNNGEDYNYTEPLPKIVPVNKAKEVFASFFDAKGQRTNRELVRAPFSKVYVNVNDFYNCVDKMREMRTMFSAMPVREIVEIETRIKELANDIIDSKVIGKMNTNSRASLVKILLNAAERVEMLGTMFYIAKQIAEAMRLTNDFLADAR